MKISKINKSGGNWRLKSWKILNKQKNKRSNKIFGSMMGFIIEYNTWKREENLENTK